MEAYDCFSGIDKAIQVDIRHRAWDFEDAVIASHQH